jgi:peroxiredoxin
VKKRFAATLIVAMLALAAFASTAQAHPTYASPCSGCHTKGSAVTVTVVQTANNGVNATYKITVAGPNSLKGWAVLSGVTNVARASGSSGTFTVAVGRTYDVWGVSKSSSSMPYSNAIRISPVAAGTTGTPVPTSTPTPTSNVTLRYRFASTRGTVVRLIDPVTGRAFGGVINRTHTGVTFKNVPDGVYNMTVKYRSHKKRTVGQYVVSAGTIKEYVPPSTEDGEDD